MPRQATPLTDTKIKAVQAGAKPQHFFDGGGLFLLVTTNSSKWWRFKYRFQGKTKTISFGTYPEVSLKDARERREQARKLVANGTDPSEERKERKRSEQAAASSFQQVFHEWLDIKRTELSASTLEKINSSMTTHALPHIGKIPIAEVKVDDLLTMLRIIEAKGALEMASRVRAWTSRVFRYGIIVGKCDRDPAGDLRGAMRVPTVTHHAALATADIPAFMKAMGDPVARISHLTRLALNLLILTATRPGELRAAEWAEFDIENAEWRIPAARMKMAEEHIVPLASQALSILEKIGMFSGDGKYLFPAHGNPDRTLSENTLGKAAKALGFAVTAHGFRSTFSTYANESELWSSDAIEAQLAHKPRDAIRGAYYRGNRRMSERRRLMQWWADELSKH